ncbi:glycosyltransferase family 4 protein [Candidatus Nitrospira allomarina]|uniref:MraY family glycosyltransferase n=1 Tax=Candidatus Nitrospira allomarina TaxID=3020900 RepID=A0AA96GBK3_9BACT|nr:MraY family glycosyltransferase [Candidatus Nitrospira allomarina]WNM57997.1 MraY family glycosyltransferase [Candidatus Nitrospira allomarina]
MTGILFYAFLLSILIGTLLTPCLMLGATRMGILDQPDLRKVHKEPIARVGGIAFALGALVAIGYWAPHHQVVLGTLAGALIIVCMGSLDDFFDLPVRYKFMGQVLAAGVVTLSTGISWQPLSSLLGVDLPSWASIALTIFLLVTVTNAMNLSDGLDGLAGGLSFASFALVAYLAYQINDSLVLYLTLPVMGGLLGFLRFNTYPARVFMGDGGSQFLGFVLGVSALLLTQSDRSPISSWLVMFIFAVPLMDLVAVTLQRLLSGGSPFKADRQHVHHKLLSLGFSHHQVVLILYGLQLMLVMMAYGARWSNDGFLMGMYLLILAGFGTFYYGVGSGRLHSNTFRKWSKAFLYWRNWVDSNQWLSQWCLYGLLVGMMGFFLLGVLSSFSIPTEISYLALGLVGLVLVGMLGNEKSILLTTRMALYLGSTFVLYWVEDVLSEAASPLAGLFQGFFILLIIGLLLAIYLDKDKRFQPNPMDYLLLFLALMLPGVLKFQIGAVHVGEMMAKLIVLFFVCEVLLQAFSSKMRHLRYVSGVVLLNLAIRVFW